jgi:hypothetical protein
MPKPMIRIYNNGDFIDREMTNAEYKDHLELIESLKAVKEKAAAQEAKKQEVLDKLGLTADEVSALLS